MVNKNGFTLIEAMITISVIAISMSIAIPSYQEYVWRAKAMEAFSIIDELNSKVKKCYLDDIIITNCDVGGGFVGTPTSSAWDPSMTYVGYENEFDYKDFVGKITTTSNNMSSYNIEVYSKQKKPGTQDSVMKYIVSFNTLYWGYPSFKRTVSVPEGWRWNYADDCLVYNKKGDCYDL